MRQTDCIRAPELSWKKDRIRDVFIVAAADSNDDDDDDAATADGES